jgi:hypothetical protein
MRRWTFEAGRLSTLPIRIMDAFRRLGLLKCLGKCCWSLFCCAMPACAVGSYGFGCYLSVGSLLMKLQLRRAEPRDRPIHTPQISWRDPPWSNHRAQSAKHCKTDAEEHSHEAPAKSPPKQPTHSQPWLHSQNTLSSTMVWSDYPKPAL